MREALMAEPEADPSRLGEDSRAEVEKEEEASKAEKAFAEASTLESDRKRGESKTLKLSMDPKEMWDSFRTTRVSRIPQFRETPQEEILASRETTSEEPLEGGKNVVWFVTLQGDGAGAFKPRSGENTRVHTEGLAGTYYRREYAAYLVSRYLGFDLIPPTAIREVHGEIGSIQQFIPHAPTAAEMDDASVPWATRDTLVSLWLLDFVTWNSDRHKGNLLVENTGLLHAIDNGGTFGLAGARWIGSAPGNPLKGAWFDTPIPSELRGRFFGGYAANPEAQKNLEKLLLELLPLEEVEACGERIRRVWEWMEEGMVTSSRKAEINFFGKKEI